MISRITDKEWADQGMPEGRAWRKAIGEIHSGIRSVSTALERARKMEHRNRLRKRSV